MPKVPKSIKKKVDQNPTRLSIRDLSDELQRLESDARSIAERIDKIYLALFSVGLDSRGPIVEDKTDIPF